MCVGEDGVTQQRQSPATTHTSPGRSLAERQFDTPKVLQMGFSDSFQWSTVR